MGRHVAVVVDEYGSTAGIITLADLLRALVGRLKRRASRTRPPPTFRGTSRMGPCWWMG
jgi:CBS domain containing-hemolysin-like protein